MKYLTLLEGKKLFNKLWPLLDLRAELDLRLKKYYYNAVLFMSFATAHTANRLDGVLSLPPNARGSDNWVVGGSYCHYRPVVVGGQ